MRVKGPVPGMVGGCNDPVIRPPGAATGAELAAAAGGAAVGESGPVDVPLGMAAGGGAAGALGTRGGTLGICGTVGICGTREVGMGGGCTLDRIEGCGIEKDKGAVSERPQLGQTRLP